MLASEVQTPILNSPFLEPSRYWKIHTLEPAKEVEGRRPPTYLYLPPGAKIDDTANERNVGYEVELQLVSLIRKRLAEWRPLALKGEGGVSRVTMELLKHWRREGRWQRLFFAQLEAAEAVIFMTEARQDFLQGIDIPPDETSGSGIASFRRLCCRMATGAGKTTVMAMLAAWSILNKVNSRSDRRFSDAVLIVCPNVTIRSRLGELRPERGEASIYRSRDLVPEAMMPQLRQGRVLVTNWHVFEPHSGQPGKVVKTGRRVTVHEKVFIGTKAQTARGKRYLTEEDLRKQHALGLLTIRNEIRDKDGKLKQVAIVSEKYIETDASIIRRVIEPELGKTQNILVFNDEAHHAYRLRSGEDDDEGNRTGDLFDEEEGAEDYYREATVWVEGLDRVQALRGINVCVDFSATPYFLGSRAGRDKNRIFPWTITSFGLEDAIESGVVKVPQLPARDHSGNTVPEYFNIWKWILPKLTATERGGRSGEAKPEAILKYAHTPMAMMAGMWEQIRTEKEQEGDDKRPPVFIIVCKTTKLARIVYEWLADNRPPTPSIPPANLPSMQNRDGKINTIRVDSAVQNEIDSGNAKSDETRWMRHTLDTIGKMEWPTERNGAPIYPDDFVELATKLGRGFHPPGRDVRCIVSVGMLTEGWDCNTVTHIIGLRPFMSQLLCEQVIGRGLRRMSYEANDKDMFAEETATVLGVPLQAFPVKLIVGKPPKSPARHHIHALPERKSLEIAFPRIEGYRQNTGQRPVCNVTAIPIHRINPESIPPEVEMKAGLPDNDGRVSLSGPGRVNAIGLDEFRTQHRLQERIFEMAAALARHYTNEGESQPLPNHALFAQLLTIVKRVIAERVEAVAPNDKKDVFLAPYYGWLIEIIHGHITFEDPNGSPELPRYERLRGDGTTADVDFWTSREPYPVLKSHVNAAVLDTKKLEQRAAVRLDKHDQVEAFVKNEGLGFGIPYFYNGEVHDYEPDFIVRLTNGEHLILETKGFDLLKEQKENAARRWVQAVNAGGKYGRWHYQMIAEAGEIETVLAALRKAG